MAVALPASAQFDLAQSNLSDADLETATSQFGAPAAQHGFGFSAVLDHLLSQASPTQSVGDLRSLQQNLMAQGYMPRDVPIDGTWSADWSAALRRHDRDNTSAMMSGRSPISGTVQQGLKVIGETLPTSVFQGVVGMAKGIVEQTAHTATRGGALGGAALGAAAGSVIPGVGTAAGAVVGGLVGFLGSMFAHHENVIQALSPIDEYADPNSPAYVGSHGFWEDISTVVNAALILSGAGEVRAGVALGAKLGAEVPEGMSALRFALQRQALERPPFLSRLLLQGSERGGARAIAGRVGAGAAIGGAGALFTGHPEDILPAAVGGGILGGVLGPALGEQRVGNILEFSRTRGLMATVNTPAWQVARKIFTGPAVMNVGARTIGSFGYGDKPFPVLKNIEEAPELPAVVDWAAFGLYPERFFPSLSGLRDGAQKLLGEKSMFAFVHVAQSVPHGMKPPGRAEALQQARDALGRDEAEQAMNYAFLLENHGVDSIAADLVNAEHSSIRQQYGAFGKARSQVIRDYNAQKEAGAGPLLKEVMRRGVEDPYAFSAWMLDLTGRGRGIDGLKSFLSASKEARDVTQQFRDGVLPVELLPKGWTSRGAQGFTREQIQTRITLQKREVSTLRGKLNTARPEERGALAVQLDDAEVKLDELKKRLDDVKPFKGRALKDVVVAAVRKDTPLRHDFNDLAIQYEDLRKAQNAAIGKKGNPTQVELTAKATEAWLDDLVAKGILPGRLADAAKTAKAPKNISEYLTARAKSAGQAVNVPDDIRQRLEALGFKPAFTGTELLMPHQAIAQVAGLGDYTRRAYLWDTLGLGTHTVLDRSLNGLRQAHMVNELTAVLARREINISGRAVLDLLRDHLREIQDPELVPQSIIEKTKGHLLQKTDVRDLTVDDVRTALSRVAGVDDAVARELMGAVKRGSSFGGEVHLMHPLDSARSLGRATRASGLPGFADAIRSWHMKDPAAFDEAMKGTAKPRIEYHPEPDFVHSKERGRVEREMVRAVAKTKIGTTGRQLKMMLLDAVAKASVEAGKSENVDAFFKGLSADYIHEYAASGSLNQTLLKRVAPEPTHAELVRLSKAFDGSERWYENSAFAFERFFPGKAELTDGRTIAASDLVRQLVAVTSPQKNPLDNFDLGLAVYETFLREGHDAALQTTGLMPSTRGMVDDILHGHTVDRWVGKFERAPGVGKNAVRINGRTFSSMKAAQDALKAELPYEALGRRLKVTNFYHNLMGGSDRVTVDTWMFRLFGIDEKVNTAAEYQDIVDLIRGVAKDTGQTPMGVQAALWAAVKEESASKILAAYREEGLSEKQALALAAKARDARDYLDLVEDPKIARRLERLAGHGHALLQRVADDVQGSITFGPDYDALIRFYRTADTSTIVHEYAHLLRRVLPDEDVAAIEAHYGVAPEPKAPTVRAPRTKLAADPLRAVTGRGSTKKLDELLGSTLEHGGATMSPHSGSFYGGKGFGVALNEKTLALVDAERARQNPEVFRAAVRRVLKKHPEIFASERAHIGTWNDNGQIHIDASEVIPNQAQAEAAGRARKQKAIFNFSNFEDIVLREPQAVRFQTGGNWTRNAEEAFAVDAEKYLMSRIEPPRQVRGPMKAMKSALGTLWGRFRGHVADRVLIDPKMQQILDGVFSESLAKIEQPAARPRISPVTRNVLIGAGAGAALGAVEGRSVGDTEMGALAGALGGLGVNQLARLTHGYLPDALARANGAIRYSLSWTFDARRYTKNNLIAMSKYHLPGMLNPRKYVETMGDMESLFDKGGLVSGDGAWGEALRYLDKIYRRNWFTEIDGLDKFASVRGILGFNPRSFEAAHAYLLRHMHPKWSDEQVLDAVSHIAHYGLGRTNIERTANFIFFPLSFEKKLMTAVGDAILQAPFRNLVIYEGLRRYYAAGLDKTMHSFLEKHAPLLEQIGTLNAFSHGIGPGRFFGSGFSDQRSNLGRVAMATSAMFLGGSGQPAAETLGHLGDMAVNAFTPLVITGQSIDRMGGIKNVGDIIHQYVPFVNDLSNLSRAFSDQVAALGPGGEAPFSQLQDYYSNLREFQYGVDPLAKALGFSSVDGFLSSNVGGTYKAQYDQLKAELSQKYPSAVGMISQFTNKNIINEKALLDLASHPHRSQAQEAILSLAQQDQEFQQMVDLGLPRSLIFPDASSRVRATAMQYANDRDFQELWKQIFEQKYGPIREVA